MNMSNFKHKKTELDYISDEWPDLDWWPSPDYEDVYLISFSSIDEFPLGILTKEEEGKWSAQLHMRIEKEYGKTPLEALKKAVWEIRCFRDTTQIIMNHFEG